MMRDYDIKFVNKEITPFGGLSLFLKMLDRCHFDEQLVKSGIPSQGSNRGYNPVQIILGLFAGVWCGASRFGHLDIVRYDTALCNLLGWNRGADHRAYQRYLNKFSQATNQRVRTCSASCSVGSFPSWCLTTTRLTSIPRSWSVRAVRKEQPRGITRSVRAGPLIIRSWPSCRTFG